MPLRIVCYTMRRDAHVMDRLTRCINARTIDTCRQVWCNQHGQSAILFDGDTEWTRNRKPVNAELSEADVVVVHDGRVAEQHRKLLNRKPVLTLAENWLNIDYSYIRQGMPGVVLAYHQATMPIFRDWNIVPLPVPLWEECYRPTQKPDVFTICFAPSIRRGSYPPSHRMHWQSNRYRATMLQLRRLASVSRVPIRVRKAPGIYGTASIDIMRASHVVLDECVTGSYHRESLDALAAGSVVLNGLGLSPEIEQVFRNCSDSNGLLPFTTVQWESLPSSLEAVLGKSLEELAAEGERSRRWMEQYWNFDDQWERFWKPAILAALAIRPYSRAAKARALARRGPGRQSCQLSVIVVSHNEGAYLRRTVEHLMRTLPLRGEVVVVDDCSTDSSTAGLAACYERVRVVRSHDQLGVASARNFGATHALGEFLVFADAHVVTPENWHVPLLELLRRSDIGAVVPAINNLKRRSGNGACGGTWRWDSDRSLTWKWLKGRAGEPGPVPLLCGCFIAMRRDTFNEIGGFDSGMIMYGAEDTELSMRLWTRGFECWVAPQVVVSHRFGSPDSNTPSTYKFQPVNSTHNELRIAAIHFGFERLTLLLERLMHTPQFSEAFGLLATGDALSRRREFQAIRNYDDDWFFSRFEMA
jgi:GT2 family glycosyltransferase